jgi:uncharacterized protein YaiI (UPF0178 family)
MGTRTIVYIDADACPVTRETIAIARAHHVPVVLAGNESQNLARYTDRPGVESLTVGIGPDAADYAIVSRLTTEDVVVTDDLGLVAMVMGKGARALGFRGRVYLAATIDAELAVRHAEQRLRRAGGRTRGPSPLEQCDKEHFRQALERMLREPRGHA